jgi:hypothetical protein
MPKIAVSGAIVEVKPLNPSWAWGPSWRDKPGQIPIEGSASGLNAGGTPGVLEADLLDAIRKELNGKAYVAPGFPGEGYVGSVTARIDGGLADPITFSGKPLAAIGTKGTLIAKASQQAYEPVTGARHPGHLMASWEVVDAAQAAATHSEPTPEESDTKARPTAAKTNPAGRSRAPANEGSATAGETFNVRLQVALASEILTPEMLTDLFPRGVNIGLRFAQMVNGRPVMTERTVVHTFGTTPIPYEPPADDSSASQPDNWQVVKVPLGQLRWGAPTEFVAGAFEFVGDETHLHCVQTGLPFLAASPKPYEFQQAPKGAASNPRWRGTYAEILEAGGRGDANWRLTAILNRQPDDDRKLEEWSAVYVPQPIELIRTAEIELRMEVSFPRVLALAYRTEQLEGLLNRFDEAVDFRASRVALAALLYGIGQRIAPAIERAKALKKRHVGTLYQARDPSTVTSEVWFEPAHANEVFLRAHELDMIDRVAGIMEEAVRLRSILTAGSPDSFMAKLDEERWGLLQTRRHGVHRPDLAWLARKADTAESISKLVPETVLAWIEALLRGPADTAPLRAIVAAIRAYEAFVGLDTSATLEARAYLSRFPNATNDRAEWEAWLGCIEKAFRDSLGGASPTAHLFAEIKTLVQVHPLSWVEKGEAGLKFLSHTKEIAKLVKGIYVIFERGAWRSGNVDFDWLKHFKKDLFYLETATAPGVMNLRKMPALKRFLYDYETDKSRRPVTFKQLVEKDRRLAAFKPLKAVDALLIPLRVVAMAEHLSKADLTPDTLAELEQLGKGVSDGVSVLASLLDAPEQASAILAKMDVTESKLQNVLKGNIKRLRAAQRIAGHLQSVAVIFGVLSMYRQFEKKRYADGIIASGEAAVSLVEFVAFLIGVETGGIALVVISIVLLVAGGVSSALVLNRTKSELALAAAIGESEFGEKGVARLVGDHGQPIRQPYLAVNGQWQKEAGLKWARAYLALNEGREAAKSVAALEDATLLACWGFEPPDHGQIAGRVIIVRPRLTIAYSYRADYVLPGWGGQVLVLELTALPKRKGGSPFRDQSIATGASDDECTGAVRLSVRLQPEGNGVFWLSPNRVGGKTTFTIVVSSARSDTPSGTLTMVADSDFENEDVRIEIQAGAVMYAAGGPRPPPVLAEKGAVLKLYGGAFVASRREHIIWSISADDPS